MGEGLKRLAELPGGHLVGARQGERQLGPHVANVDARLVGELGAVRHLVADPDEGQRACVERDLELPGNDILVVRQGSQQILEDRVEVAQLVAHRDELGLEQVCVLALDHLVLSARHPEQSVADVCDLRELLEIGVPERDGVRHDAHLAGLVGGLHGRQTALDGVGAVRHEDDVPVTGRTLPGHVKRGGLDRVPDIGVATRTHTIEELLERVLSEVDRRALGERLPRVRRIVERDDPGVVVVLGLLHHDQRALGRPLERRLLGGADADQVIHAAGLVDHDERVVPRYGDLVDVPSAEVVRLGETDREFEIIDVEIIPLGVHLPLLEVVEQIRMMKVLARGVGVEP